MMNKNNEPNEEVPMYGQVDERTKAVVYRGDAYTGRFMLFAVLFDVFIRGFHFSDFLTASNWDLMAIVIVGGLISTVYQVKNKVIFNKPYKRSFMFVLLIVVLSAVAAVLAVNFMGR